jgi:hypothetical protein
VTEEVAFETPQPDEAAKPRLVLMGEFSAGKSTLSNILLEGQSLPMRVTATRLPPVQISYGAPGAFAVGMDGTRKAIDLNDLEAVSLEETQRIEVQMEADALQLCDLVDMPGISDPNMPQEIWENEIGKNDRVVWCTHATQAWRQSEAAIWNILREKTSGSNLLLITQFDKLQNDRDKARVLKRVERETQGLFDGVYPVSLLAALNAGDDYQAWEHSGAAAFSEHIIRILMAANGQSDDDGTLAENAARTDIRNPSAVRVPEEPESTPDDDVVRVMPRRIVAGQGGASRSRPTGENPVEMGR